MENDIIIYTAGFVTVRLALLIGFGYAVYLALRPRRVAVQGVSGSYRRDGRRNRAALNYQYREPRSLRGRPRLRTGTTPDVAGE